MRVKVRVVFLPLLTLRLTDVTILELTLMWLLVATPYLRVDLRARLLLATDTFPRCRFGMQQWCIAWMESGRSSNKHVPQAWHWQSNQI